jgi:multicomponent Na+:H+ antiporter subunit F
MNQWLWVALLLLAAVIPCGIVCLRGKVMERLAALQGAQILVVFVLLMLAKGYGREIYYDAAVILALLNLAAGLVFIRFLERWL